MFTAKLCPKCHVHTFLNTFMDGDSITSPGRPFQCLTTPAVKKCFLMSIPSKPSLVQFEAVFSHPVSYYPGELTPYLATPSSPSFQTAVESDNAFLKPPFLPHPLFKDCIKIFPIYSEWENHGQPGTLHHQTSLGMLICTQRPLWAINSRLSKHRKSRHQDQRQDFSDDLHKDTVVGMCFTSRVFNSFLSVTITFSAANTKLEGVADTPDDPVASQRDFNSPEKWTNKNLVRLSKEKYKVLPLGMNKLMLHYELGATQLESS